MNDRADPERRVSVLQIIPRDGIGGVEVAARSMLAREDLACDFKLLLIAGKSLASGHPRIIETGSSQPFGLISAIRAALAARREAPDVVICSLWRSVPAAVLAKLLRPRTRLVYFLHADRASHFADALFSRIGMAMADAIWADSDATRKARLARTTKLCGVISFVLDAPPEVPAPASIAPNFVSWSRITRQKGIDRALEWIAALERRGVTATFDHWGPDGGDGAALKAMARRLGIEKRVAFHGPAQRDALPEIAARHSFFLQLSRFEGMAMSVIEAMRLGLVPVTTAAGQMASYVRPGETGIRVDVDRMDEAIDDLMAVLALPDRYLALRDGAIAEWRERPAYAIDVCRSARVLIDG